MIFLKMTCFFGKNKMEKNSRKLYSLNFYVLETVTRNMCYIFFYFFLFLYFFHNFSYFSHIFYIFMH